jgi:Sugar (and other) transporter
LVPNTRALAGTIINLFFGTGQAIMAGVAWGVPYWRTFLQVIYAPIILVFVFHWLIEESSRWLLTKKRYQDVLDNVQLAAKANGRQLSDKTLSALKFNAENASKFKTDTDKTTVKEVSPYMQVFKSKTMVLRLLKCSFWWITCVFCFYGLSINAVALAGNLYLNFIFAALVEIPAHLLGLFGVSYIGRKWTIFIAFVIGGISLLSFAFIPVDAGNLNHF